MKHNITLGLGVKIFSGETRPDPFQRQVAYQSVTITKYKAMTSMGRPNPNQGNMGHISDEDTQARPRIKRCTPSVCLSVRPVPPIFSK